MVKIEADKSARWYARNCAFCGKQFKPLENRVRVRAVLMSDRVIHANACESCAGTVSVQYATEKATKELRN